MEDIKCKILCITIIIIFFCNVEEEIDRESLLNLTQDMLKELIPKIGIRANVYNNILLEKKIKNQTHDANIFENNAQKMVKIYKM